MCWWGFPQDLRQNRGALVASEFTFETERHRGRRGYRQGSREDSPSACASERCVRLARRLVDVGPWIEGGSSVMCAARADAYAGVAGGRQNW